MRRTLIIIAAVVVLLLIGVGVYFIFFAPKDGITGGPSTGFPGSTDSPDAPNSGEVATQELGVPVPNAGTDIAPRLVRITDRPVALGSVAVYIPPAKPNAGTSTPVSAYDKDIRVQYIERESGNVFSYMAHARVMTRLSNKTLPGIQRATWLPGGSEAYVQFLEKPDGTEQVGTYALPAQGDNGFFLEPNLSQVLVKGSTTLITLLSTSDGSSVTQSSASGANLRSLFSAPLSSIRLALLGPTNYLVTTKASAETDGYSFMVDGKSSVFTRILGPLQSLVTLPSPSGKYVLYSYMDRGKVAMALFDTTTHVATRLPLATIPDKCVWTSDNATIYCGVPTTNMGDHEPDYWYQGVTSFSDRLWKIDVEGRVATLIIDPKQAGSLDVDFEGMTLDSTNDVLVFRNKRDLMLYAYDLAP